MKIVKVPKGKSFASQLKRLNACSEAREWVGKKSLKTAWRQCENGDWMLWLAGELGVDRRLLVLAACDCARTALKHVPKGEDRPLKAIEVAEAWTRGEANLDQVRAAARAAANAANAASAAAYAAASAASAAYAAAYTAATSAAAYAANAAYAAAYAAADTAAWAASASAADDARATANLEHSRLVRATIPLEVVTEALALKDFGENDTGQE